MRLVRRILEEVSTECATSNFIRQEPATIR
jgi:hypothetical protein